MWPFTLEFANWGTVQFISVQFICCKEPAFGLYSHSVESIGADFRRAPQIRSHDIWRYINNLYVCMYMYGQWWRLPQEKKNSS